MGYSADAYLYGGFQWWEDRMPEDIQSFGGALLVQDNDDARICWCFTQAGEEFILDTENNGTMVIASYASSEF